MENLLNKILGAIALMLFSPVIILISVLIFLFDGLPILFKQKRLGKRKLEFVIFKFRTMKYDNVSQLGSWLRKTGLDELPQLFNIILGDMNAVGPRPLTKSDCERFGYTEPSHLRRWTIKPGVTGMSQIMGCRDAESSLKADLKYITIKSIWVDLRIILITVLMNIFGKQKVRSAAKIGQVQNAKVQLYTYSPQDQENYSKY